MAVSCLPSCVDSVGGIGRQASDDGRPGDGVQGVQLVVDVLDGGADRRPLLS